MRSMETTERVLNVAVTFITINSYSVKKKIERKKKLTQIAFS